MSKMRKGLIAVLVLVIIVVLLLVAYQLFRFPAKFRHLTDESLSAEQVSDVKDDITARDDKKVLVAYFSYSGTTKRVADSLSEKIGADLFEIAPQTAYSNVYWQSNLEIRRGDRPALAQTVPNMEEYDIVFIGYPVWFHATPAPINTFLESYDLTGKLIIPFCTSGGSDISETMPTFLDSCKGLAVYGQERIQGTNEIDQWLDALDLGLIAQN